MRIAILGLVALWSSGCGMYFYERTVPFNEEEYKPYAAPGEGSIAGQAFLKTQGGDVKFGAGATVTATPVTSYSEEWFREYTRPALYAHRKVSDADPGEAKYLRTATADGQGNFLIEGLPPGEYFVTAHITWSYASYDPMLGTYMATTGGGVGNRIKLGPGEKKERFILTR
ncbi:hypothetical protein LCGC14_1935300 [marine sediment metagenome]|uniref:Carboxypeptidase regulatory-like domain-containing protein n=1 Tax=marine sediment metagenome TaxID=412755 RepID=A0A0F9I0J1_9ZZZZ